MARENSKLPKPKARSRAVDGFVMMAMALVTLALGMGLVLQAGLSVALAGTVAVAFYLGLLSLHTLARRHDQLDQLKVEIEHLKGEVARLGGMSSGAVPNDVTAGSSAPVAPAAGPPTKPQTGPARPVSAAAPQNAAQSNAAQKTSAPKSAPHAEAAAEDVLANEASARDPGARDEAVGTGRPAAAPATYLGVPQPPPPSVVRAPQAGNVARAPYPPAKPARRDIDDNATTRAAVPAVAGINRVPRNAAPAIAPATAPGSAPHATGKPAESVVGGENRRGASPPSAPAADTAVPPSLSAATEPVLPGAGDARDEAWSYRPGDEMQPRGFSPRESDVEMIQGLIKKLADEVNAVDAGKLAAVAAPAVPPRRAVDEATLDQSVGALRRTAQTMKAPAAATESEADVLPSLSSRAVAKHAVAPEAAVAANPPELDEAEFDVDALMRRAEPIASMTSMPPPLPMASNALSHESGSDGAHDRTAFDADTAREVAAFEAERREESSAVRVGGAPVHHGPPDAAGAHVFDAADAADDDGDDVDAPWAEVKDDSSAVDEQRAALADVMLTQIADAIEAGRIDVFLEPILDLGKQQPRHYEVSLSLRDADGAAIAIDDDDEAEYPSGALPLLDSLRLSRTAHVARRLEERSKAGAVFSTFSGQSLTSDDFLTTFADTYDANERLAGQLILTFSQADVRRFRAPHWAMVREMRELGFGFAVRAVTDLDMDFAQLVGAGFKFAKLDAGVFLEGLPAPGAVVPAADICKFLAGEGLALVIESIDDDAKRARVFGFGVLLGQGALFGGPRLMKAAAISGAQSAAA